MGLAAGINFSLRSVALAAESYRRDEAEQLLKPDEILQMFGRAGRRGLDETGYVLITANELRLLDAHTGHLSRSSAVDWSALLGLMTVAANHGRDPFTEAVRAQERLFSTKPIFLGVEESLRHPETPCGLKTDAERARHVRKRVREMLNSRGEWEVISDWRPARVGDVTTLTDVERGAWSVECGKSEASNFKIQASGNLQNPNIKAPLEEESTTDAHEALRGSFPSFVPVLGVAQAVEKVGFGALCVLSENESGKIHGRALTVADRLSGDRVLLAKWIRRLTNWNGRQVPLGVWTKQIVPLIERKLAEQKTPVVDFQNVEHRIIARVSIADLTMRVPMDKHGVAIWKPIEREVLPSDCARCSLVPVCRQLPAGTGVALLWRRLGLVDPKGVPTLRGQVVSFFTQGDGLAIAAALEDESYPLEELIYDLANLDAGFRFCGDDNRWGGRLAVVCHQSFGLQSIPGYLENGVPPKYGAGAEQVVASVHKNPVNKHTWITDLVGPGDIDRIIIEWRSLLRQIAHAPDLNWPRWRALQALAKTTLNETESPTLTDLPPLEYNQTKRVDHRLILRRH
jgi:hypothetical protein